MKIIISAILFLAIFHTSRQEEVRLLDLDPQDAQQIIEQQDTSLKYAPKVESNVPAVRYIGNEPQNVVEDIYLANQYHGQDSLGGYLYGYSVPDIAKTEKKQAGGDLRGAYNYIAGNGQEIKVEYWDDGTGFHQVDNVPKNLPEDLPEVKKAKEEFARIWQEQAERNSHPVEDPYNSEGQYKEGPLSVQGQLHRQQQFTSQFGQQQPQQQQGSYPAASTQHHSVYQSNLEKAPQTYNPNYQPYQGRNQQNQGSYQSKQYQPQGNVGGYGQGSGKGQGYGTSGYGQGNSGQGQGGSSYSHNNPGTPGQGGQGQGYGKPGAQGPGYGNPGAQGQGGQGQGFGNPGTQSQGSGSQGTQSHGGYGSQGAQSQGYGKQGAQSHGYGNQGAQNQGFGSQGTQSHGYGQGNQGNNPGYPGSQTQGYGESNPSQKSPGYQTPQGYHQTQYQGQSSQNVNQYTSNPQSSYSRQNPDYSRQSSHNQGNQGGQEDGEDDGQYHEKDEEQQGPPKGFFYKFDYPVGIIVSKQGSVEGKSYGQQGGYQPQNKQPGTY